jgi:hypothetical protein
MVHYCVYSSLPLGPILSQMNSVHNITLYLCKISFNIIFSSVLRSRNLSLPLRLSSYFSYPTCMLHVLPANPSWSNHHNNIRWIVQIINLLIMQFSPILSYLISYTFHSTFFSKPPKFRLTPALSSSLKMRDQVSHLYQLLYHWHYSLR